MDGKTTAMMEEAVSKLADLPSDSKVYITGAHTEWLLDLSRTFKGLGLVDVIFYTPTQIINGALMGCRGILMIDDVDDLTPRERAILFFEQKKLEAMNIMVMFGGANDRR